ncbi:amino acid adenylation domain-containing protein [Methanobacterium sp.]|uniref:amino acid adenylation domain-containing protein n=1 Tax=Methanobacterium sp. TaxID=2164 RepID=UPI003C763D69
MQKIQVNAEMEEKIIDCFDLSNAQKRTIITEISKPGNEAYILSFKSRFPLEDEKYVKNALSTVISGNIHLRMKQDEHMNFRQYYASEEDGLFSYVDMSYKSEEEINDFINEFAQEPFKEIFDAPLYQFTLLKTENESIVLGRTHHIIMDGSSVSIFAKNLEDCVLALKKGDEYQPSNISYEEYVKKEKEYLSSEQAKEDQEFWLSNLDGYSKEWYSSDDLSINRNYFYLDPQLTEKLKTLSAVNGVRISPFVLALSAVSLYFAKSTCSSEMVWNSVYHGRDFGEDIHDMLGMFVNMMPLKLDYDKNRTFKEVLLYTKSILKNGLTHGKLSFNMYGPKLQQKGIDPAMLSMYSMVSNSTDSNIEYLFNNSKSEFPFHIRVNSSLKDKDGLQLLEIEYNKDCFSDAQISCMVENIHALLYDIADNPDKTCDEFEIETSEFYNAEKYFKNMMRTSDGATVISPDINGKEDGSLKERKLSLNKSDIEEFCKDNGISPNSLFLAATLLALGKFVFNKNILISIVSNYLNIGQELPFAVNIDTVKNAKEYLKDIQSSLLEVVNYDYYPFTRISSKNFILPEFLYVFGLAGSINEANLELPKLTICIEDNHNDFKIISHYNDALYSEDVIETFIKSVKTLVIKLIQNPHAQLKDISILPGNEKEEEFKINMVEEPLLNKLFEKQVDQSRDKIALIAEDGEFTYDELNKKSNRIANALIKLGIEVEDRIMLMLKRDSRLIAAMLGIVKAGCAFIPVDPEYPAERINQVLEDSDAKYIITKAGLHNALDVDELLLEDNDKNPSLELTPENLCYLIYTSGSTGKPKGVMLTHGGITNYVSPDPQNIPIHALVTKASKMISISTVSFIVFLREIFATIMNGMPVVLANEEQAINPIKLSKLFEETGADAFGGTPTRLLQYLELEEIQRAVYNCNVIIVGGETFPPQLYNVLSEYTDAKIYNSYGPTEITIASHGKLITSDDISVGEPLLNVTDKIMDMDANPLPYNVVGELYVAGAGVARGYWNNEELTKERFVIYNGLRYYNTGDLAKRDSTGELYVLGRMDNQIKLRGLRIELGEIENAVMECVGIKSAFALVKTVRDTEHICAYFTEDQEVDASDLRNTLVNKLPAYMVPSYFVRMDSFPMTPNGKTDLKNFPDPEESHYGLDEIVAPETDLERDIFDMCSEILDTTDFGVITDLFQLGLTSLSVLKLVAKISQKFGVTVNVTNIMRAKTIREIANEVSSSSVVEEKHYQKQKFYPLTQSQMGVYFDCVKNPEKLIYNIPKCIHLGKDIDPDRLRDAVIETVNKHPYIKTKLAINEGIVCQERCDDLNINVDVYEGIVDDKIKKEFVMPFELVGDQLFRFAIYKNEDEVCLLCDFHHIILDGGSLDIFLKDLAKIYGGEFVNKEKYTGFDLSLDETEVQKSNLYREAETYFESKIIESEGVTVISPDISGKEEEGGMAEIFISLDKSAVEGFCKDLAITPNNLFLASTLFTLSKFVYNKDILISTISSGRSNIKYQNSLAMMVKTLPYVLKLDTSKKITDFLAVVQDTLLDVMKYECYPFTKISDKYDIFPEFLYAYQTGVVSTMKINGKEAELESLELEAPKFKLSIAVEDTEDQFKIVSQYNDAIYSEGLMETFIQSIATVIDKVMKNPKSLLKDISIVSEDKETEFELNPVKEQLLNKVFEKQVDLNKDKIALVAKDGKFTYDELNRKANRIANALIKRGASVEDRVMFIMKRDSRLIATMLGIMKSGCAFIPVDPEYPEERIKHVLEDSNAKFIITDGSLPGGLEVDELLSEDNEENPNPNLTQDNLCYMIYTSGSTGKPKGVMLTHAGITNYVYPHPENNYVHFMANNLDNYLSLTTVSFDVFIEEIFAPLMNGLAVVLANDEETTNPLLLAKLMGREKIEGISVTPSRLLQYLELENMTKVISNCKCIIVGGEGFPPQLYDIIKKYTDANVYNSYGPTEITIASHGKLLSGDDVSIGKTLFNVVDMIADAEGNPLPPGVVGELYVGGAGVSRGYWNLEERNKEQFVVIDGVTYYKTGDFAKKDENEEVFVLGRLDNQIKLRGLRIEIGEIESAISNYEGVKSAAVLIKKVSSNDHLCAYFAADTKVDIEDLKTQLKSQLTKYMVPTVFLQLDELPQTPNGKTDLKSLPEPVLAEREYVAPENDVEEFFAETFSKVLDIPKIGATDNFFDLGGTSLLATKIIVEGINNNYDISYGDIFSHQTPRELAKSIINVEDSENTHEDEEFAYGKIDKLLEKNTVENFRNGELQEVGNVLLTGATGFLGIHILRDFLENEIGMVYCMLRKGRRSTSLEERLKTLLFYYFSESYEDLFGSRIHIIEGDISNKSDFNKALTFPIDTVINCAANVKHYASGTQIEDINVGGVVNALEFCKKKDAKLIQISTVSVGGWSVGNVPPLDTLFDEKMLFVGQNLDHKYIYSKFKAECIILEAVLEGLNAKIMRVGNLMARNEDSEFQINFETNAFINGLKSYNVIGKIPYSNLGSETELTPIDSTARAILLLTKTPRECVVFHPYNNHSIYISDVVEIMNELGLNIVGTEENEFNATLLETMKDETKSTALSGIITTIKKGKGKDKVVIPAINDYTTQILYRLGFKWPLTTDKYLATFIEYLEEMDFFDVD